MQEFIARIASKGRITIPAEVRRYFGLATGDKVVFIIGDDGVRIEAQRYPNVAALKGAANSLEKPFSWQEIQKIAYEDRFNRKDTDA